MNSAMLEAERAMLGKGLPHRPWFRHTIYAPGEYTGYAAVVIPGVNESMDRSDLAGAAECLNEVTVALERAAAALRAALDLINISAITNNCDENRVHLVANGGTTPAFVRTF